MGSTLPGVPLAQGKPTHSVVADSQAAKRMSQVQTDTVNNSAHVLEVQDDEMSKEVVFIYNIHTHAWSVQQPPLFPNVIIPGAKKKEPFSVISIPRFVREPYERPGTTERYYKRLDGRKCATSLLNPDIFPGINWEMQLREGVTGRGDMTGTNLNAYGVFWSLTHPEDPELEEEIKLFRARLDKTMNELAAKGDEHYSSDNARAITPLMHEAMDYWGRQADWHTTSVHFIPCPLCGERVREGIAFHTNAMGLVCIIDMAKYQQYVVQRPAMVAAPNPAPTVPTSQFKPVSLNDLDGADLSRLLDEAEKRVRDGREEKPKRRPRS